MLIELTELVHHSYATPVDEMTLRSVADASRRGGNDLHLLYSGAQVYTIDVAKNNAALTEVILRKVKKQYSKPKGVLLWLVVFTVDSYNTECIEKGELYISERLVSARNCLQVTPSNPFDGIWFTGLQTRPVRVWPLPQEGSKTKGSA